LSSHLLHLRIGCSQRISPPNVGQAGGVCLGTAAVYRDPALLWRGARAVFGRGAITTPEDLRPLIEAAADTDNTPPALVKAADTALGRTHAQVGLAAQNVLDVWRGYDRNAGLWEPDDRTPTRLKDRPMVTLRLARLRDGAVVPYAEDADPRRAWALSEVSVARFCIAACPLPAGTEAAAADARAQWGRWERDSEKMLLALLTEADGGSYKLTTRAAANQSAAQLDSAGRCHQHENAS
jgi:CRISPR-associated endonuclease/helicase Cas3